MLKITVLEVSPSSSPVHTWPNQIPLSDFTNSLLMVKVPIGFFSVILSTICIFFLKALPKTSEFPQSISHSPVLGLSLFFFYQAFSPASLKSQGNHTFCPVILIRPVCNCLPCLPEWHPNVQRGTLSAGHQHMWVTVSEVAQGKLNLFPPSQDFLLPYFHEQQHVHPRK